MNTDLSSKPVAEVLPFNERAWAPIIFLTLSPVVALLLVAYYISSSGFIWTDLIPFFALYIATGLAITAGYHRLYAHKTYECSPIVELLVAIFGAAAGQNAVLNWASDHRYHHQYSDREGDPYNINKGFFYAHMGWMFWKYPLNRPFTNVPDLKRNAIVMWQYRNFRKIMIGAGFVLPMLIGACFGRPFGGLLWGGLFRMVVVQHFTFTINSFAHTVGHKTYDKTATARDSYLLALISYGEGYHSFHHAFPNDYRNGIAWYHYDPSKWLISGLSLVGLTRNLRKSKNIQTIEEDLAVPALVAANK